jgi:hypothetical protein
MESIAGLICVILIAINIIMIVKFFQIAESVKSIQNLLGGSDISDANIISLRMIGDTDGMYRLIINKTVSFLEPYIGVDLSSLPTTVRDNINRNIEISRYNMQLLGRQLPDELQSLETYQTFRKNLISNMGL